MLLLPKVSYPHQNSASHSDVRLSLIIRKWVHHTICGHTCLSEPETCYEEPMCYNVVQFAPLLQPEVRYILQYVGQI